MGVCEAGQLGEALVAALARTAEPRFSECSAQNFASTATAAPTVASTAVQRQRDLSVDSCAGGRIDTSTSGSVDSGGISLLAAATAPGGKWPLRL